MSDPEKTKSKSSDKAKAKSDDKSKSTAKAPVCAEKWDDYIIAKGRIVECNRGQLGEGSRIRKGDFDSSAFEMFKERGVIVKG